MDLLKTISFSISLFLIGAVFILLGLSGGFSVNSIELQIQETWTRIISFLIGSVMAGVAVYIETRLKRKSTDSGSEDRSPKKAGSTHITEIDAHGWWSSRTKIGQQDLQEKLLVESQEDGKIEGIMKTVDPINGNFVFEYDFHGEFINSNTVRYWFEPRSKGNFVDFGVGILEIESNNKKGHGHAVIYGIVSEEVGQEKIAIASFNMEKEL